MNVLRRPPSRVIVVAIALSLFAHAVLLPFVHAPAAAQSPKRPPAIITFRHERALPTPQPTPLPARAAPHRVFPRPAAVPRRRQNAHVLPPHTNRNVTAHATNSGAKSLAIVSAIAGALGDPQAAPAPEAAGPVAATDAPQSQATPLLTPAPLASKACPSEPHDATVTQAVTPERPQTAIDEDAVGRVVVEVQLARDGAVVRAGVHESSGNQSLDRAAVAAATNARYAPASDGCEPIAGSYLYVVEFTE